MKVLTLTRKQLNEEAHKLLAEIQQDQIHFDMVIGIAIGGIYVSQPIKEEMCKNGWTGKYNEIKLSRKSTDVKQKWQLKKILTKLPYSVLNLLRIIEVKLFEQFKAGTYNTSKENHVIFSDITRQEIMNSNSILLIDDAIDTGSTVLAIKNVLKKINPDIDVKIAVLTVTHTSPYIKPDYTLYKHVLLRCPWAEDYKGMDKIG